MWGPIINKTVIRKPLYLNNQMARKKKTNKVKGTPEKQEEVWEKRPQASCKGPSKSTPEGKKFQMKLSGAKTGSG